MSRYFEFLRAATDDKFLALVREQVTPSRLDKEEDVDSESEDDAVEGEDSEPEEELKETETKAPKMGSKPNRRNSAAVVSLVHKFEPRLKDCKSDTNCLMVYTQNNIKLLDKSYGSNLEQCEEELNLLRKLLIQMYPNTGGQRNIFKDYTALFKAYYVPKGESEIKGPHIELVRKC